MVVAVGVVVTLKSVRDLASGVAFELTEVFSLAGSTVMVRLLPSLATV